MTTNMLLKKLQTMRASVTDWSHNCVDESFRIGGYDAPTATKMKAEELMGRAKAYKNVADRLSLLIKEIEQAQDEEAEGVTYEPYAF